MNKLTTLWSIPSTKGIPPFLIGLKFNKNPSSWRNTCLIDDGPCCPRQNRRLNCRHPSGDSLARGSWRMKRPSCCRRCCRATHEATVPLMPTGWETDGNGFRIPHRKSPEEVPLLRKASSSRACRHKRPDRPVSYRRRLWRIFGSQSCPLAEVVGQPSLRPTRGPCKGDPIHVPHSPPFWNKWRKKIRIDDEALETLGLLIKKGLVIGLPMTKIVWSVRKFFMAMRERERNDRRTTSLNTH